MRLGWPVLLVAGAAFNAYADPDYQEGAYKFITYLGEMLLSGVCSSGEGICDGIPGMCVQFLLSLTHTPLDWLHGLCA